MNKTKAEPSKPLQPEQKPKEPTSVLKKTFSIETEPFSITASLQECPVSNTCAEKKSNLPAGSSVPPKKLSVEIVSSTELSQKNGKGSLHEKIPKRVKLKPRRKTQEELANNYYNSQIKYNDGLALIPVRFKILYEKVKKPAGAEIEGGLPSWNTRPLDTKLNIIPAPHDAFVCARGKVGERLWKTYEGGDFVFYDPYGYEFTIPYDPLHDKHLKRFFKSPVNVAYLQRTGSVTENRDAVCSLKEYNSYRKYLYKVYSQELRKELLLKNSRDVEEMTIKRAVDSTKREIEHQKQREIIAVRHGEVEAKREAAREKQAAKCQIRLQRVADVQREAERRKYEAYVMAEQRNAEFKNRIQQRVILAEEIAHKRKIDAFILRQETDAQQKFNDEQKRIKRKMDRENKIRDTWNQKIKNQNFGIEREDRIRDARAKDLKSKANKRLRTNIFQKHRREEHLRVIQKQVKRQKERNYNERLRKVKTRVKFSEDVKRSGSKEFKRAPKTIAKLVEKYKKLNEIEDSFVESENVYLSPSERVPNEVKDLVTTLLNQVIKAYIKQEVSKAARILINDALNLYDAQVQVWHDKAIATTYGKRQSLREELSCLKPDPDEELEIEILMPETMADDESERHVILREISFGETEIVHTHVVFDNTLKCVKDRIPTPFPSLENIIAEEELQQKPHLPYKENLEPLIAHMFQSVLDILEIKIVNRFLDTGDVTMLSEPPELVNKEQNLIDYVTSTLVYVTETLEEIDEDECVGEIARFISKHIFSFT